MLVYQIKDGKLHKKDIGVDNPENHKEWFSSPESACYAEYQKTIRYLGVIREKVHYGITDCLENELSKLKDKIAFILPQGTVYRLDRLIPDRFGETLDIYLKDVPKGSAT